MNPNFALTEDSGGVDLEEHGAGLVVARVARGDAARERARERRFPGAGRAVQE
jgi:hypothetical protein